jgi:hypothetical protein
MRLASTPPLAAPSLHYILTMSADRTPTALDQKSFREPGVVVVRGCEPQAHV